MRLGGFGRPPWGNLLGVKKGQAWGEGMALHRIVGFALTSRNGGLHCRASVAQIGLAAALAVGMACGSASVSLLIGVSTAPGPTPVTMIPWTASSTPAVRVNIRMPPLDRQ